MNTIPDTLKHYTDLEQEQLSTLESAIDSCNQTLAALQKRAEAHLIDTAATWAMIAPTGNASVAFSVTAAGQLRYSIDGGTPRNIAAAFDRYVIRLAAYPAAGQSLDLYWDEGRNRYVSQDGKIIIRKVTVRR